MRIGFLAEYSDKIVDFATRAGFGSLELIVAPGSPLDPNAASEATIENAKAKLAESDIEVSALGYHPNHLSPDKKEAEEEHKFFVSLMDLGDKLGVKTLCTFAGRDPDKDLADNIPEFKRVWEPTAKLAEDRGFKIGFENCPMFHYFPFRGINMAYCPRAWDMMFDAVPSPALGLEYDPSHLICMFIDYIDVIRRYGSRIVHVHAKDAQALWQNIRVNGILEPEAFWHRFPGLGDVNWAQVVSTLVEVGYRGNLDIEGFHDPIYRGDLEETGLIIGLKHLSQFVADGC